jgi:hypothetical protein
VIVIPVLLWLGAVGKSSSLWRLCKFPEGLAAASGSMMIATSIWPQVIASLSLFNFGLLFWVLAVTVNLLLTGLVLVRLLRARRHAITTLGRSHARTYTSVVVNLIKSSLVFTLMQIVFLGLYSDQSLGILFLLEILTQLQVRLLFDVIGTYIKG